MSDELTPITDFHELRKIVNAGTVILQVATTEDDSWREDKRKVTTTIGAIASVEIIERGANVSMVLIWMKDRHEPILLDLPEGDEPTATLSYRVLSAEY